MVCLIATRHSITKGLDNPCNGVYNTPMSKTTLTITVRTPTRRNTQVVDALREGIRLRSKTWSKNGRFASARDERRANRAAIRRGDW